jgi:hypothetical protein
MKHSREYMKKKNFTRNIKGKSPLLRPSHGCEGPLKEELTGKTHQAKDWIKMVHNNFW